VADGDVGGVNKSPVTRQPTPVDTPQRTKERMMAGWARERAMQVFSERLTQGKHTCRMRSNGGRYLVCQICGDIKRRESV
jgi:hypothetical protein